MVALEPVAFEFAVLFHVADDGLDGASAAQLALDGRRGQASGLGDIDLRLLEAVAAIALIDVGASNLDAGEPLDLSDLVFERVPIVGQARTRPGADDELAAEEERLVPRPPVGCGRSGVGVLVLVLITAKEALTPNSKRVRAFPLAMHSTSG